ncbi:MAG: tetraacyldisaccharide 4'-kinase [Paracoccaceae bacterium]
MRPPRFWHQPAGLRAAFLAPLAAIWAGMAAHRLAKTPGYNPGVPVICVGNINAGGTGKTPATIALLTRLADRGAHVISRGYGGSITGPHRVDAAKNTAADVGDEPLLMAAFAPVWVGRDRVASAKAAVDAGAKLLVLDDGFQNPGLVKTLSIVVVDAEIGFGNGRVMPAGPLREPIATGLARADLVLAIGGASAQASLLSRAPELAAMPLARGHLAPLSTGLSFDKMRVIAFAGIGRPGKFFATLRKLGANIIATHEFGDHAPLAPQMLTRMRIEAKAKNAMLVTTEKDAVRLPAAARAGVIALPVRLELLDSAALDAALSGLGLSD